MLTVTPTLILALILILILTITANPEVPLIRARVPAASVPW